MASFRIGFQNKKEEEEILQLKFNILRFPFTYNSVVVKYCVWIPVYSCLEYQKDKANCQNFVLAVGIKKNNYINIFMKLVCILFKWENKYGICCGIHCCTCLCCSCLCCVFLCCGCLCCLSGGCLCCVCGGWVCCGVFLYLFLVGLPWLVAHVFVGL